MGLNRSMETNSTATQIADFAVNAVSARTERECSLHLACGRSLYRAVDGTDADTAEVRSAWSDFLDTELALLNTWAHRAWVGMA